MAKKVQKSKASPPSLQNGAADSHPTASSDRTKGGVQDKVIIKLLLKVKEEELSAFETPETAVSWLSEFIENYLKETSTQKHSPGQQLKLAATNAHDDLMELLVNSQSVAEKFYSSRTIKSGRSLRKIYLQISKICLAERKVVLGAMGKKRTSHE